MLELENGLNKIKNMKKISLLSFVIIFLSSCSIQKTVIQYTEFPITEGEWLCKIRKSKSFSIGTDDVVSNRFGKRFYFDFTLHYDVFCRKKWRRF